MCLIRTPDFFDNLASMPRFNDPDPNELMDAVLQLFRTEPESVQDPAEPAPAQEEPDILQSESQGTSNDVSDSNATDYSDYCRTLGIHADGEYDPLDLSVDDQGRPVGALPANSSMYTAAAQNFGYISEGRTGEMMDYSDYGSYDNSAYSPPPTYVTSMHHPVVSGNFRYETAYMNNQLGARPPRPFQLNPNTEAFYPRSFEAHQHPRTPEMPPSYSASVAPGYYSPRPPPIPSYYHHGYQPGYPPVHPVRIRGPVPPQLPFTPRPVFLPPPSPAYPQVVYPPTPYSQPVTHFVSPPSPTYLQALPVYPPGALFYYPTSPHDMTYYAPPPEIPATTTVTPGQHYDYSVNNSHGHRRNARRAPEQQQQPRTAKEAGVDPKKTEEEKSDESTSTADQSNNSPNRRNWSSDTEEDEVEYEEVEEEEEELDLERSMDSSNREDDNGGGGGGNCPAGSNEVTSSSSPRSSTKGGDKTSKGSKSHNGDSKTGRTHQVQHSPRSARSEKAISRPSFGATVDQILSEMQDYKYTFYYRDIEFPFTSSCGISSELGPLPAYHYFVPPTVRDADFFGGQLHIWRDRMIDHFYPFWHICSDIWKLMAIPDFKRDRETGWNSFVITSKLRFACRSCKIPWTSMRGKLQFAFLLEKSLNEGFIFLKCFGQVCIQETCRDRDFQTPAFYPEEIERVVGKLAEYIGYVYYDLPLSPDFYRDPDKAVRMGNPKSPHVRELCHACTAGMCSRASS